MSTNELDFDFDRIAKEELREEAALVLKQLEILYGQAYGHGVENFKSCVAIVTQQGADVNTLLGKHKSHVIKNRMAQTSMSIALRYTVDELKKDMFDLHVIVCLLADKLSTEYKSDEWKPNHEEFKMRQLHSFFQFKALASTNLSLLWRAIERGAVIALFRLLDIIDHIKAKTDKDEIIGLLEEMSLMSLIVISCIEPAEVTIKSSEKERR